MLRVINGKTAAPKCVRQVNAVAPEEVERSSMEIVAMASLLEIENGLEASESLHAELEGLKEANALLVSCRSSVGEFCIDMNELQVGFGMLRGAKGSAANTSCRSWIAARNFDGRHSCFLACNILYSFHHPNFTVSLSVLLCGTLGMIFAT